MSGMRSCSRITLARACFEADTFDHFPTIHNASTTIASICYSLGF
jgi:hypothetical protein